MMLGVAGVSPAEGVAENAVGDWSEGKAFPSKISPQKATSTGQSQFPKSTHSCTKNTAFQKTKSHSSNAW